MSDALVDIKEHLKLVSWNLMKAHTTLDYFIDGENPKSLGFQQQSEMLNKLQGDYDDIIVGISTGNINTVDSAISAIKSIEARYPKEWK